jgi:hypothetical protein
MAGGLVKSQAPMRTVIADGAEQKVFTAKPMRYEYMYKLNWNTKSNKHLKKRSGVMTTGIGGEFTDHNQAPKSIT